jgi:hypothetical protein
MLGFMKISGRFIVSKRNVAGSHDPNPVYELAE